MAALLLDPGLEKQLRDQRRTSGADRYDEVWEGVYRMSPSPNNEHQTIVSEFDAIFRMEIAWKGRGEVHPGTNVSDRDSDWEHNYRVPDVAVFLKGGQAQNRGAFWLGGPDFVVEISSPYDDTREKIPFYAKIGTREMLIIDRDPWMLELLRLHDGELKSDGQSEASNQRTLVSQVIPFTFRLVAGVPRPRIEVASTENDKTWMI
jgi:Uma2 family endonuclease